MRRSSVTAVGVWRFAVLAMLCFLVWAVALNRRRIERNGELLDAAELHRQASDAQLDAIEARLRSVELRVVPR